MRQGEEWFEENGLDKNGDTFYICNPVLSWRTLPKTDFIEELSVAKEFPQKPISLREISKYDSNAEGNNKILFRFSYSKINDRY